ncbi:hexitol phosphatase HxpB [Sediminibacterium sp.]|uniref:hexitol phosphatase HxpB n=1 Tax=Sediminibacterium sp. TaxID=1917865 RepID=UPI003F703F44
MALTTVIFDIDGLLIDSEPLWHEAATELFNQFGVKLTDAMYTSTTGLRTKEFVQLWFDYFKIDQQHAAESEKIIVDGVLKRIEDKAGIMPGVPHIFDFFANKQFKIGLATSSPPSLIDLVVKMTGIAPYLSATASAEYLPYGKPHPQVYLNCAEAMNSHPTECICFEDSFNGLIAAKAARMKCVVIPHHSLNKDERWGAADLKLSSLQNFGELHFDRLNS